MRLVCEPAIAYELSEYFTFNVPGAKFSPAYKNKMWDGKIRLFHVVRQTLYVGLLESVKQFAQTRGYQIEFESPNDFAEAEFALASALQYIEKLNIPLTPREYQIDAFVHAIRTNRTLLVSPTASGKSLIIYLVAAFLIKHKVLIVVPNINLVNQLASDFVSYGCPQSFIHTIFSGQDKDSTAPITITTWQSVYLLPQKWFERYGVVIGDEAHQFKAKSLIDIMEKMPRCKYRFGFTGTLDGTQTNKLVLEGLFGPVKQVTTTAKLMESKEVSSLKIKAIVISYEDEIRKLMSKNKPEYKDELKYLITNVARNKFISNLTTSLKKNTLVLFNFVDHGKMLFQQIQQLNPERQVFNVYGKVGGDEREEIRQLVQTLDDAIIVASYKTFSTGVNIPNIHNVVFASPSKSRIRVLQSIGRGLRLSKGKNGAVLYDVADDLSWKSYKNSTINHFAERIQMYNQEGFDYKIYTIKMKVGL